MSYFKLHVLTIIAVLFLCSSNGTATASCLASFREIKFPDGSARVKNYVCQTEDTAKPEIRVEFDRLSEAAAGSLVQGTPDPDLERAFGNVRVVQNAVGAEAKKIFDEFGIKETVGEGYCFSFLVSAAAGGTQYEASGACQEQRTLWSLTSSVGEMPLVADIKKYQTSSDWPEGYNFFYSDYPDCSSAPIYCTFIWRAARPADIVNFDQNKIAYDQILGLPTGPPEWLKTPEEIAEWKKTQDTLEYDRKRYFALINYLTQGHWPDDFLIVTGTVGTGECSDYGLGLSLHVRQLILDVAFIQNVSDSPVSIDGLLGTEGASTQLRPVTRGATAIKGERVALTEGQIQPGEIIAVPLAISFVIEDSLKEMFGDQRDAEKTFKQIRADKAGTVFQTRPGEPTIRKHRESFGPPKIPKPATYAFGPELRLTGLVMDGKSIIFDQASRNFMRLTSYEEGASCPYLYAWDDGHKTWVRHGKIIHAANSKDKETTEKITFSGFRSKFRLAEEELEVSYIDSVKLEVELGDGTGITLRPSVAPMSSQDRRYATIRAGQTIEFSFELPPTINAAAVKQSTLAVTGYYQPYSSMMMARQSVR